MLRARRVVKCLSDTLPKRCYAERKRGKEKGNDEENEQRLKEDPQLTEAQCDYLRTPPRKWRKKQSPLQYEQEKHLADNFAQYWQLAYNKYYKEAFFKTKLQIRACESLPEELRREAFKVDYSCFPVEMCLPIYHLPMQPGYELPLQPYRSEL
ncbi:hypothetical protein AKO1_003935 [Acrasis kona]|uniref:Uncharacterized protein n=1 Tax=Acrasis kona TaxID=1008807 RepID=A0AAW2ZLB7_9EUKA